MEVPDVWEMNEVERLGPGRPKMIRTGKPGRLKKQLHILSALVSEDDPIPVNCKDALSSTHAPEWLQAMEREYNSLVANQTWRMDLGLAQGSASN